MKHISTLLLALMLAGILSVSAAQDDAANLEGEITDMAWDVAAAALDNLVPGFNEQYPNVTVNVEDLGNEQVSRPRLKFAAPRRPSLLVRYCRRLP